MLTTRCRHSGGEGEESEVSGEGDEFGVVLARDLVEGVGGDVGGEDARGEVERAGAFGRETLARGEDEGDAGVEGVAGDVIVDVEEGASGAGEEDGEIGWWHGGARIGEGGGRRAAGVSH